MKAGLLWEALVQDSITPLLTDGDLVPTRISGVPPAVADGNVTMAVTSPLSAVA